MKIAITGRTAITAKKDGAAYVKYTGFSKSGEVVEAFVTADKDTLGADYAPEADVLEEVFETLPKAEVEFNQRGRVDSIEPLDDEDA